MSGTYIVRTTPALASGELQEITVGWATESDVRSIEAWAYDGDDPNSRDAAEFALSAVSKWVFAAERDRAVFSETELLDRIGLHPSDELSGLLVAKARWWAPDTLAFALFHRTWHGNLYLDFLAAHPGGNDLPDPAGVGPWLLYELCLLARTLEADFIWGETTELSAPKYRKYFGVPATDLLRISKLRRDRFIAKSVQLAEQRRQQIGRKP